MNPDAPKPFTAHLDELRRRIIRAAVVVLIVTFASYGLLYDTLKPILSGPLEALNPDSTNPFARYNPVVRHLRATFSAEGVPQKLDLHAQNLTEVFMVKFKIALLAGAVISAPYVLYQAWAFIGTGLLPRERRVVRRCVPLSVVLFLTGVAFGYFIAVPAAVLFLVSVDPQIKYVLMYGQYFGTVVRLLLLFGVAFQMPLVAMILTRTGLMTAKDLAAKRRYAIVLIFAASALLTPPDPFSQCLLAIPMIALYELGVQLARRMDPSC